MTTAVQYEEFGGPEVLKLAEIATPTASSDGVVVEVKAAGVNPIDAKIRSGARASGPIAGPRRLGSDAAGVIVEVGPGAAGAGWAIGDEVVVRGASGAYATHVAASTGQLVRKPENVSWEVAAAIGVPVSTAYQVLRSLGVGPGTVLLIHGGSGSVGRAAIQFARLWGATVIATAREDNHARLRELGAIPVSYGPGLAGRIREVAPGGIDRVLDAIGSDEALETSFELVSDRSHIGTIVVGRRAAELGILAWSGGNPIPLSPAQQALRAEAYPVVLDLLARGEFQIDIARTFPLSEAADAHRLSESGHPNGKIILLP
jgi:NADPH:quinone reductase-like Zn-dependent oxidoreductase